MRARAHGSLVFERLKILKWVKRCVCECLDFKGFFALSSFFWGENGESARGKSRVGGE